MSTHDTATDTAGGLRAELAPYLPTRRTMAVPLRALGAGSTALLGRGWAFVRGDLWPRLGGAALGGYMAVHAAAQYGQALPWVATGGACVWCVAAWLAAPAEALHDDTDDTPREEEAEEAEEPTAEDGRTALLLWLEEITRGRNGVHLRELYPALRARPALADLTDAQLRAALDHHQVPVTRSLTVDGISGKSGVRRADVLPLLHSPDPSPAQTPLSPTLAPADQHESRPDRGPVSGHSRRILGVVRAATASRDDEDGSRTLQAVARP